MGKSWLVARREFLDTVRTKTFWIGILSFPVILGLAVVVPMWLERSADVRRYAVVDRSGWLADAVEERAAAPDLAKVFAAAVDRYKEGGDAFQELPDVLRLLAPQLAALEPEQLDAFAESFTAFENAGPELDALREKLPPEAGMAIGLFRERIRLWWKGLPPEDAERLAPDLDRIRYERLAFETPEGQDQLAHLNALLDAGEIFAYFVIGDDPVGGSGGCKYVSTNLTDEGLRRWFSGHATALVRRRRLEKSGVDEATARYIGEPVRFEARKLGEEGEEEAVQIEDTVRQWAPVMFVYLLWIAVFTTGQMLLTNTIEEKSNRIIEVLLSSISPLELMAGKIAGIAGAGLTVVGSWVLFVIGGAKLLPLFLEKVPEVDLGLIARDPALLGSFVLYFLLGYLFYAALMTGIGSVCNSLKEAQNLMQPIVILLILPLLAMVPIGKDPNGLLAQVLSYIPPFTPFVMMNRAAGPPTAVEYALTTALLLVSIAIAFWGAAKIFRIGILMTGKPPRPLEILRWLRAPVGRVATRRDDGDA
jgi:ABC-type Na+ efflux pump permease subunit